ncbi:MAG: lysophospholipid acyltransferase family protein [Candidatus Sumerlaeia bacterium]|nr:lysophospholipid acyltransferase family protein [Candidatus Sumerlaeia bacterium]
MSGDLKVKLIDYITFYGAKPIILFIRLLPLNFALQMAKFFGWLAFYFFPVRKRVVLENLRIAFGKEKDEQELRRIACHCYQNFAMMFVEFIKLPVMSTDQIASLITEIKGLEYFQEVGGIHGGYIVVGGHLGNWELVAQYFTQRGVPLSVVVRPMHNPLFDAEINQTRSIKGVEVIPTRGSLKELSSAIKQRRVVAFLIDQDARKDGIFVNFFDKPASTFTGPAVLLYRYKVPILPMFTVRTRFNQHRVIFAPPIYPQNFVTGDSLAEEAIKQIVQQYTRILESFVREYPEQYFWFHRRWKTQPAT